MTGATDEPAPSRPPFELSMWRGSAALFHARPLEDPVRPEVWAFDVDTPAVVLGSRQHDGEVDVAACSAEGIDVVHRRSGGGAVLLAPGDIVWIDVILPAGDPRWVADVGAAMVWMGEAWSAALARLGVTGLDVHRGRMVEAPWSDRVCFAGTGPGEVLADGRKLVGLSQRRTRAGARFQGAVHVRWDPDTLVRLLAPPRPPADQLPDVATVPADVAAELPAALTAAL